MARGPAAAAMELVAKALSPDGAETSAALLREVCSHDKVRAEIAARTLKKIAEADRSALYPWRKEVLREALRAEDVRVQWNLTIVLGRLPLKGGDKSLAVDLMFQRLQADGSLNRTFALQALVDLSEGDPPLRARVRPLVLTTLEDPTPAVRARARKLFEQIG